MRTVRFVLSIAALVGLIASATGMLDARERQFDELPLRMTATIVNTAGVSDGRNSAGVITITRWTSAAERDALIATVARGGTRALLLALLRVPAHGQIRIPDWQGPDPHKMLLGWDLCYAWRESDGDGGQRIVLGTDRYISFWEAQDDPQSTKYPFTMIELHLDNKGEGVGNAAVAARVNFNPDGAGAGELSRRTRVAPASQSAEVRPVSAGCVGRQTRVGQSHARCAISLASIVC